jgi:pantetheine-phosphate adenylyltransferase
LTTAIYSGTFDPITNGHINIVKRSLKLFDKLIIAVAESREKKTMFSLDERVQMARLTTAELGNVEVKPFKNLLVQFLEKERVNYVIRGLRNGVDFEYEKNMHYANKSLYEEIETVYLNSELKDSFVSSSVVRTLITYKGNISHLVPTPVLNYVERK